MDDLARRLADRQIQTATTTLARDARRLVDAARRFADTIAGGGHAGEAYQLAQSVADLLRQAAYLDGMRTIADLHTEPEQPHA